jgi:alkylated DNA repair dioxygenase AlkB
LPDWLLPICNQLCCDTFFARTPDQVIVNEYQPGQGIAPHIDCVPCFEETIASLSLGSTCIINFTHSKTLKKASVLLEPGSLLVMSGEARYVWQHAIAHRKTDPYNGSVFSRGRRISLTFRNVILSR